MHNTANTIPSGKWIKATWLGWLMGIIFVLILASIFEGIGISRFQFFMGTGMGAGVGFMQWRVLKAKLNISKQWIWYSIVGMSIPFLLFDLTKLIFNITFGAYYLLYGVCIAAALTSIRQSQLLKLYTPKAMCWIPINFVGWVLAILTVLGIDHTKDILTNNTALLIANLMLMLAGGIIAGIVTGMFINKITRTHTQHEK